MEAASRSAFGDDFYPSVIDAAPDGILIVGAEGRILLANRQASDLFGYDHGDLVRLSVDDLLPEALQEGHRALRHRYQVEPVVRPMGAGLQLRARRRDGREVPVEISLSPLVASGEALVVAVVRDISGRLAVEEELRRVLHTLDATEDGVFIIDAESLRFTYVNEGAARQVGCDRDELLGMTPMLINPVLGEADFRRLARPLIEDATRSTGIETTHRRRDGRDVPVEMSLRSTRNPQDDAISLIAVARDITDRLEIEAHLRSNEEALRDAEKVLAIADDRERIARDLHDTVIQRLFASGLQIQAVSSRVDADTSNRLEAIVDSLDETIRELRTAIFALQSNGRQGERGLRGQLLDVVIEAATGLGFEPRLQFDGAIETIDPPVRDHVVPVVREALTNIARHAQASWARVVVEVDDGTLTVSVIDNGIGLPEDVFGGRGLTNLGQRAAQVGGELRAQNRSEGGATVIWSAPLTVDAPADSAPPGSSAS